MFTMVVNDFNFCPAAIGVFDGQALMFSVDPRSLSAENQLAKQWASFDRKHLIKHGVPDHEIVEKKVEMLTLQSLANRFGFAKIDILLIDAEGFDGKIVQMALSLNPSPICICFEYIHLPRRELQQLMKMLAKNQYLWLVDNWNVLAVRKDDLRK